jgi:hypothetical protein
VIRPARITIFTTPPARQHRRKKGAEGRPARAERAAGPPSGMNYGAPLTPEPTPEAELKKLLGDKWKPGARVAVAADGRTWWKVDGLWYRYGGR